VAVLSLETREVIVLSSDIPGATVSHLQWSADGSEIAFIRSSRGPTEIVAVDVEDTGERTLLRFDDRHVTAFAWSSDERELLVPTTPDAPPGSGQPEDELWRYSLDTGKHEVIATPHPGIGDLAWSPDDRLVALAAGMPGTGRLRLYAFDLESGTSTPVDRRRGGPNGPQAGTWSGPYLLYTYFVSQPDEALYLMRWDSRSDERVRVDRPRMDEVLEQNGSISAPRCGP
jgi:Tol biopolymer transport system component